MFKVKNNAITITRGDSGIAEITLKTAEGEEYTPQEVRAWMRSDTHREVMLDSRYKGASIGAFSDGCLFVSLELTL